MKYITSADNSLIKKIASLKLKKGRDKEGLYLVEGIKLCEEALESAADINMLILRGSEQCPAIHDSLDEDLEHIIESANRAGIEIIMINGKIFDRLMDADTPQKIGALVGCKPIGINEIMKAGSKNSEGNYLVLDRIQDPGNCGTLIRTAEAAGYLGVIAVKGTADPFSPKVVRSAAGSLFRMPMVFTDNAKDTIELIGKIKKKIVVTTPYCENYYFQIPLNKNVALVVGNEGKGVSKDLLSAADYMVKIPMEEAVESLNAAVAAGIIMYESVRQDFQIKAEEQQKLCKRN